MQMTMEMLFMAFMVIVTAMALFAIMVVFRDVVNEVIHGRRQREKETRDIVERAECYCNEVIPAMKVLRAFVDEMETMTASEYWPMPTYSDLMFNV